MVTTAQLGRRWSRSAARLPARRHSCALNLQCVAADVPLRPYGFSNRQDSRAEFVLTHSLSTSTHFVIANRKPLFGRAISLDLPNWNSAPAHPSGPLPLGSNRRRGSCRTGLPAYAAPPVKLHAPPNSYSTLVLNRNRRNFLKTNSRDHFYSTLSRGGFSVAQPLPWLASSGVEGLPRGFAGPPFAPIVPLPLHRDFVYSLPVLGTMTSTPSLGRAAQATRPTLSAALQVRSRASHWVPLA